MENIKNNKGISLLALIIIIVVILCGILIFKSINSNNGITNNSKLNTVVTADNYNTIGNIFNENDDNLYYFTYACLYYSLTERLTTGIDENTAMQKIYGKTVQQLVNEGKQLMQDYNMTVEQYKQQLKGSTN